MMASARPRSPGAEPTPLGSPLNVESRDRDASPVRPHPGRQSLSAPALLLHPDSPRATRHKRSRSSLAPQEYIHSICAHSRRSVLTSSFPGRNYDRLADWLLHPKPPSRSGARLNDGHSLAVLHDLDGNGLARTRLFAEGDAAVVATLPNPNAGKGHLLFLRGYLSPPWIAGLGSRYRIDPEFFYRHLDFFEPSATAHRPSFNLPSLPNTGNNIIHVYVSTILSDSSLDFVHTGLADRRRDAKEQTSRYKWHLLRSASSGDSVVREFDVLNHQFSVIEQRISICVSQTGEGWVALVWMDNGRDLNASPAGPWTSSGPNPSVTSRVATLPVIQHHPKMTLRKIGDVSEISNASSEPSMRLLPQSTSILPMEYQSLLSAVDLARRAKSDPLHALIPVFAHAAFSEVAFLNLVTELINELMAPLPIDDFRGDCFESLQQYEIILQRHADRLRSCVRSIRILGSKRTSSYTLPRENGETSDAHWRGRSAGTSPNPESQHADTSSFSVSSMLEDYDDLLDRCTRLLRRIADAMSTEMNRAMILESRRAIEQSGRVKKLTQLATYFIPLTFAASLFGMNFEVLGQGSLQVWWYVVFAIPLTIATYVISTYTWSSRGSEKHNIRAWVVSKWQKWRKGDGEEKEE